MSTDLSGLTALQPVGWSDIVPHFRWYIDDAFCHPIKVMVSNQIAGVGATIVHGDVAWLGHIIVCEAYRRQGIGEQITKYLMSSARLHGCETIRLIASDLGVPVYEKLGFETETEYLFFKDLQVANLPESQFILSAYTTRDCDAVAAMDFLAVGENRMAHLALHLEQGVVARSEHRLEGFYLPTLGEGLIISDTPFAGLVLLRHHLGKYSKAVFPRDNEIAAKFLTDLGYRIDATAKRMVLGKLQPTNLQYVYNRIAGNLG